MTTSTPRYKRAKYSVRWIGQAWWVMEIRPSGVRSVEGPFLTETAAEYRAEVHREREDVLAAAYGDAL